MTLQEMETDMNSDPVFSAAVRMLILLLAIVSPHAAAVTPAVASGAEHTLALTHDGRVLAFGGDSFGQLGRGRVVQSTRAVKAQGLTEVSEIAVGAAFVVALKNDGTVWAWGKNGSGQLGDGSRTASSIPFRIRGLSEVKQVAAGVHHVLFLKNNGSVWGLGKNTSGQLGVSPSAGALAPVQVQGLSDVIAIAGGLDYSMALRDDGTVWTWGNNGSGQLGAATQGRCDGDPCSPVPVQVTGLPVIAALAAGWGHNAVLTQDKTVWVWGANGRGQLGDGTKTPHPTPVPLTGLTGVTAIAAGFNHTLAIKSDRTLLAWGANGSGQLGNGTATDSLAPAAVPNLIGVTAVSAGGAHSVALLSDGTTSAWGFNGLGQLGDGTTVNRRAPVPMQGLDGIATVAAAGFGNSVALRDDGTVWSWGSDGDGQLGASTIASYSVPGPVPGLTGVESIAAGRSHAVALKSNGDVWGSGTHNRAGQAVTSAGASLAAREPLLSIVTAIAAGDSHTVALRSGGSVWAWGWNGYGQLGDGTTSDRATPIQVSGLPPIAVIGAGWHHNVAAASDGTIWTWGDNAKGQLGVSSSQLCSDTLRFTSCASVPRQMAGLPFGVVTALAAGADHTLALSEGTVWAWGNNLAGQLGNGKFLSSGIPQRVSGLSDVTAIAANYRYSLALKENGSIWAWGANYAGQLGNGTNQNSNVPVPVQGLSDVISISAGVDHAMAVKGDGTVWGWGWNDSGNLGDGTYSPRRTPVLVRNETFGGALDLDTEISNDIPADRIPAMLLAASKSGGRSATSLSVTLQGRAPGASFASAGVFADDTYNVYVAALAPALERTGEPVLWQLDSGKVWTELTVPMKNYLSGAALDSQTTQVQIEILANADLSTLADTVFYVGYGIDTDEMLGAGRYQEVFTVSEVPVQ